MRSSSLSAKDFNFENATENHCVQINQKCLISIFHANIFFFCVLFCRNFEDFFFPDVLMTIHIVVKMRLFLGIFKHCGE